MNVDLWLNWLPIVATVFMTICYAPQIKKTITTKDVRGQSVMFWTMLNIALTLLLLNSILLFTQNGNWGYMVSYILNESLALTMLLLVLKYRKNKESRV
jgi:uncharacterized protein with PQ loop repeat